MSQSLVAALADPESRTRRVVFVAAGSTLAVMLAGFAMILANSPFFTGPVPYAPTAADGYIAAGTSISLADDVPAITNLDAALLEAARQAEADAAAEDLVFEVTGGWRSAEYQGWLFDAAVDESGSEQAARASIEAPGESTHVAGTGIDIGPSKTQFWLLLNGARYGLCQTSPSERSHFQLATTPGGTCPAPSTNEI